MENNNLSNESVFSKGFNTLEKEGGRYYVKMQFQNQADAYAAYRVIQGLKPESPPTAPKTATQAMLEHEEIQQRIRLGARQSGKSWLRQTTGLPCPNHGNSHCVQCFWPPRAETFDKAIFDEFAVITDKQFEDFERMLAENPMQKNKALVQLMDRPTRWTPDDKSPIAEAVHNTILYGTGAYAVELSSDKAVATAIKTGEYITDSGYDGFDNGVDE